MHIAHLCYELYKLAWEQDHKITRTKKKAALLDYYKNFADNDFGYTFEDYLDEFGYDGEIYVCYDEFLDNEYLDDEYMHTLLKGQTKLIKLYDKDVEDLL